MSVGKFESKHFDGMSFLCRYWETSRAWGHEVYLIEDGVGEVASARVRYYNRTWEKYTFQTAMFEALENYKKKELERFLNEAKIRAGLKGFDENWNEFEKPWRKGEKQCVIEEFDLTIVGKKIKALHKFVEA